MQTLTSPTRTETVRPEPGDSPESQRVLAFKIGSQSYAVDILQVCEIRSYSAPMKLAHSPCDQLGVMNLRGEMVPVVDLRLRLGAAACEYDAQKSVIVVERDGKRLGAVVDSVSDVLDLAAEHLRPVPSMPGFSSSGHLRGIATIDDQMLVLVDIASLVGSAANVAVAALH